MTEDNLNELFADLTLKERIEALRMLKGGIPVEEVQECKRITLESDRKRE